MLTFEAMRAPEMMQRLQQGLVLRTGPYRYRVHSNSPLIAAGLVQLYGGFRVESEECIADFHVHVRPVRGFRRWFAPQVNFWLDDYAPFLPLPAAHAFALLEWGMNWCLASQANHHLLFHAAVLEKDGQCLIMPGEPGAGKSTLTAALMLCGWRLLSDEMTMIDRDDGLAVPLARPVSLKNQSIDVIRNFSADAVFGASAHDTHKGTVSHLRPSALSVASVHQKVRPTHVIFPRWRENGDAKFEGVPKALAFERLAKNSFNYSLLGRLGFDLTAALIDGCQCWDFSYSKLSDGLEAVGRL